MESYRKQTLVIFLVVAVLMGMILTNDNVFRQSPSQQNKTGEMANEEIDTYNSIDKREWIIKWKSDYNPRITQHGTILNWEPEQRIMRIRIKQDISLQKWLDQWSNYPEIEYMHPNQIYRIATMPNDSYYEKQHYLKQIKAEQGWDIQTSSDIVVAILDTGVDLGHTDLKGNLIQGINLLEKEKSPQDDNGHGTNVAGIIAATGNNLIGITGMTWKTRIMPIKVLDKNGEGDSFLVGQGIRYAVDHNAKVVLLSLGEPVYTPFMKEAVDYAEEKGVLVVAASGNEGDRLNYPAAFPNVLSVGAVNQDDHYASYSNYGQQLDVVAPGEGIFTTKLGGDYTSNTGTSMAAPQVAGLAALLLQKYPHMKPSEIINFIKFTADDVGESGWDIRTGFGRINVEKALNSPRSILADGYEPNNNPQEAHIFPLQDTINAVLTGIDSEDWYKLQIPYNGKLDLNIELDRFVDKGIEVKIIPPTPLKSIILRVDNKKSIEFDVPKGNIYIQVKLPEHNTDDEGNVIKPNVGYKLSNNHKIYKDDYESNDKPWEAFEVIDLNQAITGTFDKERDEDWYKVSIMQAGTFSSTVIVDTLRIDPVLMIQPIGGIGQEFDFNGSGKEEFGTITVQPGDYYIKVFDYNGYPVNGEYNLTFRFNADNGDKFEPNDLSSEASRLEADAQDIKGIISKEADYDWFRFKVEDDNATTFDFVADEDVEFTLYDAKLNGIWQKNINNWRTTQELDGGEYFIRIYSINAPIKYSFNLKQLKLDGAFSDINEHQAKDVILKFYKEGLIPKPKDYKFRPNQVLTRGDAAILVSRERKLPKANIISFTDVKKDTELNEAISKMVHEGLMKGYDDDTFKPNRVIIYSELIQLLAEAYHIPAKEIEQIHSHEQGKITKAEFIILIDQLRTRQ